MSGSSERVKTWRRKTKETIIESMGGKCQICGHKTISSLDLHHINGNDKTFSFGSLRANPQRWEKIVEELRKCVLLCANCHREIHAGDVALPSIYSRFDESFSDFRKPKEKLMDKCPICGKPKSIGQKTCSISCGAKLSQSKRERVDWKNINLQKLLEENDFNYSKVSRILGVSDNTVKKHYFRVNTINRF